VLELFFIYKRIVTNGQVVEHRSKVRGELSDEEFIKAIRNIWLQL